MLPPVRATSRALQDLPAEAQQAPLRQKVNAANDAKTAAPISPATTSGDRQPIISLPAQLQRGDGNSGFAETPILVETVGSLIKLPRRDGEALIDYTQRVLDAVKAMNPGQQATLERLLNQIIKDIPLRLLAEVFTGQSSADAARLAARLETAQISNRDLVAGATARSYRHNAGGEPAPVSFAPSAPQAANNSATRDAAPPTPRSNAQPHPQTAPQDVPQGAASTPTRTAAGIAADKAANIFPEAIAGVATGNPRSTRTAIASPVDPLTKTPSVTAKLVAPSAPTPLASLAPFRAAATPEEDVATPLRQATATAATGNVKSSGTDDTSPVKLATQNPSITVKSDISAKAMPSPTIAASSDRRAFEAAEQAPARPTPVAASILATRGNSVTNVQHGSDVGSDDEPGRARTPLSEPVQDRAKRSTDQASPRSIPSSLTRADIQQARALAATDIGLFEPPAAAKTSPERVISDRSLGELSRKEPQTQVKPSTEANASNQPRRAAEATDDPAAALAAALPRPVVTGTVAGASGAAQGDFIEQLLLPFLLSHGPREGVPLPIIPYPPEERQRDPEDRKAKAVSKTDEDGEQPHSPDDQAFHQDQDGEDESSPREDHEDHSDEPPTEDAFAEDGDDGKPDDYYWRMAGWA